MTILVLTAAVTSIIIRRQYTVPGCRGRRAIFQLLPGQRTGKNLWKNTVIRLMFPAVVRNTQSLSVTAVIRAMADRRCLRKEMLFSDQFLNMPAKVCLLYILLNYSADDDGFVDSPGMVLRSSRCSAKDLKSLEEKGYILQFDSGVILIRHWLLHNTIKSDRYHPTMHEKELGLVEKDRFKVYQLKQERSPKNDSRRPDQYDPVPADDDGAIIYTGE